MLSKTNVHHFAGNNVSHPYLLASSVIPARRPDLRVYRAYPAKKSTSGFGGYRAHADLDQQIELGTACGKLYRCSTMAVLDAGDSDILSGATA